MDLSVTIPHTRSPMGFATSFDVGERRPGFIRGWIENRWPSPVLVHVELNDGKLCADCRDALSEELSHLFGSGTIVSMGDPEDIDSPWFIDLNMDYRRFHGGGGMGDLTDTVEEQIHFCETGHEGYMDDPW